jgi:hypothetical protein
LIVITITLIIWREITPVWRSIPIPRKLSIIIIARKTIILWSTPKGWSLILESYPSLKIILIEIRKVPTPSHIIALFPTIPLYMPSNVTIKTPRGQMEMG